MKHQWPCLLFVLCGSSVLAGELFVSPQGNDGAAGSREAPFATIAHAASVVQPGDTVHISAGLYREQVVFRRSGTAEKPIVFEGERDSDGNFLTIVEGRGKELKGWIPAPEIHPEAWKVALGERPQVILQDGKMIALIHHMRMALPRWKTVPDRIETNMIWGPWGPSSPRLPGLDILAAKPDILFHHKYMGDRAEPFYPTLGHVACGWLNGWLYIRYTNGHSPEQHAITACGGNGFTVRGGHLIFRHLQLRGSRTQFVLEGKDCLHNTIDQCLLMHGGKRIYIGREARHTVIANSILTCGFIQPDTFILRSKEDMRGGLLYETFKYIIGTSSSDDVGVDAWGKDTEIHHCHIMQGLIGMDLRASGTHVHHNVIRELSSVGICTNAGMVGEIHHNIVTNCGIPIRIHDLRAARLPREEYIYRNWLIQKVDGGSQFYVHCESYQSGPDAINFEKGTDHYLANPPAPVDAGKFYIYHNTLWGGDRGAQQFNVRYLRNRFREPMPFYFLNNITRHGRWYDPTAQHAMAGNLFYTERATEPPLADKSLLETNRDVLGIPFEKIWPGANQEGIPNLGIDETSAACGTALDVSREMQVNGHALPPLKGFAHGYFKGEKPAAGAMQVGDSPEEYLDMYRQCNQALRIVKAIGK